MVLSKLKRYLNIKHNHLSGKDTIYFSQLLLSEQKQGKKKKHRTIIDEAHLASYIVSEIVAKKMKPHTLAEKVILLACKETVKCMLAENAVNLWFHC